MSSMKTDENRSQTLMFFWVAQSYEARWAESPEEVPIYDVSRGFPLSAGADLVHKKALADPNDINELRPLLRGDARYSHLIDTWEPNPPPTEGYPRLVREDVARHVWGTSCTDADVVGDVNKLARHISAWLAGKPVEVLKREILELNAKYGAPYSAEDNTLEAWLKLAVETKVHIAAMRELRSSYKEMCTWLETEYENLANKQVFDERGFELATEKAELSPRGPRGIVQPANPFAHMIADFDNPLDSWELNVLGKLADAARNANGSIKVLRVSLADAFKAFANSNVTIAEVVRSRGATWLPEKDDYRDEAHKFRLRVEDYLIGSKNVTVTVQSNGILCYEPIVFFLRRELAKKWRHGAEVRLCKKCGLPFPPSRSNIKYCNAHAYVSSR